MAKRKAEVLSQTPALNGSKKIKKDFTELPKPNLLDDSDSDNSSDESDGGAKLEEPGFKINEEFAKRFEHNSKRAELHKLEEKYQNKSKPKNGQYGDKYDEDSESSSDPEDEDDEGILATEDLDAQISATLKAIRTKDPSVYNKDITFYAPIEENSEDTNEKQKKEKPMHLNDYHRENLLNGYTGADEDMPDAPRTFAQEQDDLKTSIVKEIHAAQSEDDDDDEDGGFLIPKPKLKSASDGIHPSRQSKVKVNVDVSTADKDPESFISNFMAARAWIPSGASHLQPFESDDEAEDERAENFEEAYNLRFEDPKGSNEMLKSYARDIVAAKSVRREEVSGRKKQRDMLRERKAAEQQEREEERAQLRRLKIEEAEEKLQKVKKAAGIKGKALKDDEWVEFLGEDWDDDKWEAEMAKRFGDDYYAEPEAGSEDESDGDAEIGPSKKRKVKKPKWDNDIDINDIIPDFVDEDESKPAFTLSESEEGGGDETNKKSKTSKDRQREKQEKKKAARIERKRIEELVDSKMDLDLPSKSKQASLFRYRETSPTSFGLTARDILMAPETSLNQFAGLKKMATFRDADKKRKDKKHLGKKARLRQWRKETFGNEDGPEVTVGGAGGDDNDGVMLDDESENVVEGSRKKKKRSRKTKVVA